LKNDTPSYVWTETERLNALAKYQILDTPPEKAFDDIVKLVSELLDAPIAAVNLIDKGRQWFKSEIGLGVREMPLDDSICKIAIFEQDRMIVPDTRQDPRFNCNPLVTDAPGLRFYAGELLKTPEGLPLGTLCVLDLKPRPEGLTAQQQFALETLARQVTAQIELRKLVAEQQALLLEQQRTAEELRIERDRGYQLFHGMDEGYVFLDNDFRIREISPGGLKMDGRTAEEIVGLTHWDAWPGSEELPAAEAIKRAMTQRVAVNVEQLYTYPDGRKFWLDMRAYPSEGGIALFYRNITERKQAEEALKQADRRKDEFLAMLAHELRNPLAPIGAAAELLSFAPLEQQRVKQASQVILRQVRHMKGLVDDLLDVSRVTRGLITLEKNDVDIKRVIASAVEQVGPLIEAKRHHLVTDLAPETAHVSGDQKRLVQVVANLLNNSAKYTNEGGHITLKMEVHDRQVLLHVKDDGIGIAPDLQPHVFDLFAQATRSADRSQGGLGIGLALVRSLVELHGGKVACFSEGVGKGSCFTVTLPRRAERETIHAESASLNGIETAQHKLRVLVVDDNADAAQMLALLLETIGHDVLVEHTSINALGTARDQAPDVCILDIGLPDIDGYQLAQRLRAQTETASCRLIAITGYGQEQDKKRALAAGFDHHLVKPVDIIQLSGVLPKGPQRERSRAALSGAF
jgi:PAS domain S-box-containing protein